MSDHAASSIPRGGGARARRRHGAVLAHHGFSGRYDISQPLWIEGVVEEAYFGQPHPTLRVRTAADLAPPAEIDLSGAIGGLEASDLTLRDDMVVEVIFPPIGAFFRSDGAVSQGSRVAIAPAGG